jgi:hypothetical protein
MIIFNEEQREELGEILCERWCELDEILLDYKGNPIEDVVHQMKIITEIQAILIDMGAEDISK